jgi:hypothetical protein
MLDIGLQPVAHSHICKLCIYLKITQSFKCVGIPLIVIVSCAFREPALNNDCGPLP